LFLLCFSVSLGGRPGSLRVWVLHGRKVCSALLGDQGIAEDPAEGVPLNYPALRQGGCSWKREEMRGTSPGPSNCIRFGL
jgi:hypothetical protein